MSGALTRGIFKNGVPVVDKGCCCIDLKKCCIAQGVFNFLESLVSVAVSLAIFVYVQDAIDTYESQPQEEITIFSDVDSIKHKRLLYKQAKDIRIVAIVTGLASLVAVFNACFLIHAARKECAKMLNIYLYIAIIAICLDMLCRSWSLRMRSGTNELLMVGTLIIRLVQVYFLYVVYSYYKKVKGPPPTKDEPPAAEQATPLQSPA